MKTQWFGFLFAIALLLALVPVSSAFASGDTEWYGTIESLPAGGLVGDWIISGKTVHVSNTTKLKQEHGAFAVGAYVKAEGYLQADGSLDAKEIETKSGSGGGQKEKFYGAIESLPSTPGWIGDWVVSGRTVHVTTATKLKTQKGQPAVGVNVEVEGYKQVDGSLDAKEIETKSGSGGGNSKFKGIIESLPGTADYTGDWVISGKTVHVTNATKLEFKKAAPAVGQRVEVKGTLLADGTVNASKIELKK